MAKTANNHSQELQKLIEVGKEKGFLTYDEINDALPSEGFSVDDMDGLLETLGEMGIEVVDSAEKARATEEAEEEKMMWQKYSQGDRSDDVLKIVHDRKAKKIKAFLYFLSENYNLSLDEMEKEDIITLRNKLLSIHGIGPETADSIILYAFNKPIFVVDAYTYRIFSRHGFIAEESNYDEIQSFFMDNLDPAIELFKEFHALIVYTGNLYCSRTKPKCNKCPLNEVYS